MKYKMTLRDSFHAQRHIDNYLYSYKDIFDHEIENKVIIVEGKGSENIEYDIENQSNKYYYTELEMLSEIELNEMKVKTVALTKSTTRTQISKSSK